jgi:hypothetical protein
MQAELTALKGQLNLAPNLKKGNDEKPPSDKKNIGDKQNHPKGNKRNKKNSANKRQQKQDKKWKKMPPKDGSSHE